MNLIDKVVLITGASKGIGGATAIGFAKEGCSVIINFKSDENSAQSVLEECNKLSKGNLIIKADVSNEEEVKEMINSVKSKYPKELMETGKIIYISSLHGRLGYGKPEAAKIYEY